MQLEDISKKEITREIQPCVMSTKELMDQLNAIKNLGDFSVLSQDQKRELASMFARFKVELFMARKYLMSKEKNHIFDLMVVSKEEGDDIISKNDLKIALYDYLRESNLIGTERSCLGENDEFDNLFDDEAKRLYDWGSNKRRGNAMGGVSNLGNESSENNAGLQSFRKERLAKEIKEEKYIAERINDIKNFIGGIFG